jgi:hypothetical protein
MKTVKVQGESKMKAVGTHTNGNSKPVFCLTTGEVFASALDAAESVGVKSSTMSYALQDATHICKGKRFCFVADIVEHLDEMVEHIRKAKEYDKIIAEKEAINKANANLEKHKANIEKLRAQLEKETASMHKAEATLAKLTA